MNNDVVVNKSLWHLIYTLKSNMNSSYIKTHMPNKLYKRMQKFKKIFVIYLYGLFQKFPLNDKKIVLYSPSNKTHTLNGNLEMIYSKLNRRNTKVYFEHKNTIKFIYDVATSKYVITDDFSPILYPINFRSETQFIQVWHASGVFKNVGFKRLGKKGGPNINSITHKNYDFVIISSENIIDEYSNTFRLEKERFKPLGTPRTDIFFDRNKLIELKKLFYMKYPRCKGKKVILYAPTFRGDGRKTAHFDNILDLDLLMDNLGSDYILLFKNHPFVKNKVKYTNKNIIDISKIRDVNKIIPFIDILVTDYSSIIFDALLLNKNTILYTPDLEEYMRLRGTYYDIDDYNFGLKCNNMYQLITAIRNPIFDTNKAKRIRAKHLNKCDGKATDRFIKEFIK